MSVSSVYGYTSPYTNPYQSWVDTANSQTDALKDKLGYTEETESSSSTSKTDSTSSSSSTSSTTASSSAKSTSSYLLSMKQVLTDLESASAKLQMGNKDSVFSKYESAVAKLSAAGTDEEKKSAQAAVDKAKDEIASAVKDLADKYNNAVSFMSSNAGNSAAMARNLASLERSIPTEGALKTLGMSVDTTGKLQVDTDEFKKKLDSGYDFVKSTMGGPYGIAQRMGSKASAMLDSSIDSLLGTSSKTSASASTAAKASSAAKANDLNSLLGSTDDMSTLYFSSFANFAKSGTYNLSNYYAVGMMLNTLA